jgi:hypothetical protein
VNYGDALHILRNGGKVTRKGWKGEEMFLFLVPGSTFEVSRPPLLGIHPAGTQVAYRPHIDIQLADGTIAPWAATQSDLLAWDWEKVE